MKNVARTMGLDRSSSLQASLMDGIKSMVGGKDPREILIEENDKQLTVYMKQVAQINELEDEYEKLSNEQLVSKTKELRARVESGESLESILVEAFATVREASWRVLGLRHYDVQLLGGMALHDGRLAEMATGEGKTLVCTLPVYLNALSGESAMVVTTSDYLARRDGETMGQVFRFLGLSVGVIQNYQKEFDRRAAYDMDITYVANQELGFDFLRDNLATTTDMVVQKRPYNFCVVDEADSILVDEARTPLIISRKGAAPTEKYVSCTEIAKALSEGVHYDVDKKEQKVEMTAAGFKYAEQIVGKSLYDLADPWAFYIINALKAKELFKQGSEYIVEGGEVKIIDAFSGRALEGRRFTDGLQQSIEAAEGLEVSGETQVVAKVTYQNLFRLFPKLSGMTGTAFTEAEEFLDVYKLKVLPIPTALPPARRDNSDAVFRTQEGKMKAMLKNVLTNHGKGRPILIGTTSVESSEEVAEALSDLGVDVKVLNAKPENVERESEIVAQAGRVGAVTVATNMAGRGTDILLGGNAKGTAKVLAKHMMLVHTKLSPKPSEPEPTSDDSTTSEEEEVIVDTTVSDSIDSEQSIYETDSPDEVTGVEEEEDPDVLALPSLRAVAASRDLWVPVDFSPKVELALKRAVVSCGDKLGEETVVLGVEDLVARASDNVPTDDTAVRLLRAAINGMVKELAPVIKAEQEKVKRLGGLYVVGTSRHESRRIDNQLRGRAGRQGDPGASRFFLSLEDDMFKVFGADKMASMMENFRVAEDMPIESDLVVQALDKVQINVEDYFRANRQQVFKLDEVTASQRAAVYSQRRAFLSSSDEGMLDTFHQYCQQTADEIYSAALLPGARGAKSSPGGPVDVAKLVGKLKQFFPPMQIIEADVVSAGDGGVQALIAEKLKEAISAKKVEIDSLSPWAFVAFFRYLSMVQTDESWCKHLSRLDLLKEEMVLQSFTAEKDVMETYRERAMTIYDGLMDDVRRNTIYSIMIYSPSN